MRERNFVLEERNFEIDAIRFPSVKTIEANQQGRFILFLLNSLITVIIHLIMYFELMLLDFFQLS